MKKFKILALVMTCAILLSSLMIPVSATVAANPTCVDVSGRKMTIDGVMDLDEGWSKTPYLTLDKYKDNSTDFKTPDNTWTDLENPSEVYVSVDANYVYFFHKSYYVETPANGKSQTAYFVISFGGENGTCYKQSNWNPNESISARIRINVEESTLDDTNVAAIWDSSAQAPIAKIYDNDNSGIRTGYEMYYNGIDATVKHYAAKNDAPAYRALEVRFPIPQSVKETRRTADLQAYIGCGELIYSDYGAYSSSECKSGWGVAGVPVTFPKTANTAPVLVGFQSRENENNADKFDVRFVSVVDDYTGFDLNASKLGYNFTYGDKNDTKYCYKVYEKLSYTKADGSTGTISASDFGGKYFFCFTIKGLSETETSGYTFGVECFTQKDATSDVEPCINSVTVTVKYDTTEEKVVFTY